MRGCGDKCAAMIRRIQRAGISRCKAVAIQHRRADVDRDIEMIRKAGLIGYKDTATHFGCAASTVAKTVKAYSTYAEQILKEGKE